MRASAKLFRAGRKSFLDICIFFATHTPMNVNRLDFNPNPNAVQMRGAFYVCWGLVAITTAQLENILHMHPWGSVLSFLGKCCIVYGYGVITVSECRAQQLFFFNEMPNDAGIEA
ncbi:MAG: hypothetical protein LBC42_03440 [Puniceicoccales bacterium]|jgi:hypothetical protein|nr:hypothetical protein [Puniceicoccales bacterium]